MRLRLEAKSKTPVWLIGNPVSNPRTEESGIINLDVAISRQQQEIAGADWETKQFIDRGNQSVTLTAAGRFEFQELAEAIDFVATIAPNDPSLRRHEWAGNVWLRIDKLGTTEYKEWALPNAVVSLAGHKLVGATVELTYRVSASGFGAANTGTLTFPRLSASLRGINGFRLTASQLETLFADAEADGATSTLWLALYVTTRGGTRHGPFPMSTEMIWGPGETLFYPYYPNFLRPWTAALPMLAAGWDYALTDYFTGHVADLDMEGGELVINQLSDPMFEVMEIEVFYDRALMYGTERIEITTLVSAREDPTAAFLTATHDGVEYNLTASVAG